MFRATKTNCSPLFEDYANRFESVSKRMVESVSVTPDSLKKIKVTSCANKEQKDGEAVGLVDVLIRMPKEYAEKISALRTITKEEIANGDTEGTRSKAIKKALPIWYPGGVFVGSHTKNSLTDFSGLICIDVDKKDNPKLNANQMKDKIAEMGFVIYCGLSCRGQGVFALVALPFDAKRGNNYEGYYRALRREFEDYGLIIDSSCSNINRSRFISYDSEPIWNTHAQVWNKKELRPEIKPTLRPTISKRTYARIEDIVEQCEKRCIDLSDNDQQQWYFIGCALFNEFGEQGRSLFLRLSDIWCQVTGRIQMEKPDDKYNRIAEHPGVPTIGYLFNVAKTHGVTCRI